MMKFDVPKINRAIKLSEYAPEFGEAEILVWVNPPVRLMNEHDAAVREVVEITRGMIREAGKMPLTSPPAPPLRNGEGSGKIEGEEWKARLEKVAGELARIFSELWSQGPEDTRWTVEEIRELVKGTTETDPGLWPWLRNRTIQTIQDYRAGIKKG